MGKYFGKIGYGESVETAPGAWEMQFVEKEVYGDVIKNKRTLIDAGDVNDDVKVSIKISFIADPFAVQNFLLIKYATYMGTLWKVTDVEEEYPRLLLTLGGLYNDER